MGGIVPNQIAEIIRFGRWAVGQFALGSTEVCHSRGACLAEAGSGKPVKAFSIAFGLIKEWMPAFADMTQKENWPTTGR